MIVFFLQIEYEIIVFVQLSEANSGENIRGARKEDLTPARLPSDQSVDQCYG